MATSRLWSGKVLWWWYYPCMAHASKVLRIGTTANESSIERLSAWTLLLPMELALKRSIFRTVFIANLKLNLYLGTIWLASWTGIVVLYFFLDNAYVYVSSLAPDWIAQSLSRDHISKGLLNFLLHHPVIIFKNGRLTFISGGRKIH